MKNTKKRRSSNKILPFVIAAIILLIIAAIFYFHPEKRTNAVENFSLTAKNVTTILNDDKTDFNEKAKKVSDEIKDGIVTEISDLFDLNSEKSNSENKDLSNIPESSPIVPAGIVRFSKTFEIPICPETHKNAEDHEIVHHQAYTICYRESYEQAEYSAYCIDESELEKKAKRGDDFRPDDAVSTGSATLADYKASGYDRGHLSPAADFAYSEEAMSESFFMSNMSPQAPGLNRGIWKDLETEVRKWAKDYGRVYVISGPILEKKSSDYETIGKNKVVIPQYYYKVVLMPVYENSEDKNNPDEVKNVIALSFIFPNEKCQGTFWDYQTTIDEVEKRTGLDFFSELNDDIENSIEASKATLPLRQ